MDRETNEINDSKDDVVGRSKEDDVADNEVSEERNESADSDGSLLLSDNEEVHIERKHPARFNIEDQRSYFSLGVTFANAYEVRGSITKYCISREALKFVKNERNRIRVKCEDQCPFVLLVLKDNSNPRLVVRTLVLDHDSYRIFTNPRVPATFLAQHYKTRILENHNYKVKDMKKDAEEDLRVNVGYSKCKRSRRMVLDAYSRAFTTEYSELEAYVDELLRSNPDSTVKVELCRDELSNERRVFKRMFVCLDAL